MTEKIAGLPPSLTTPGPVVGPNGPRGFVWRVYTPEPVFLREQLGEPWPEDEPTITAAQLDAIKVAVEAKRPVRWDLASRLFRAYREIAPG